VIAVSLQTAFLENQISGLVGKKQKGSTQKLEISKARALGNGFNDL
jgi:hypothetical protein